MKLTVNELIEELKKYSIEDREAIMIASFEDDPIPICIPGNHTAGTQPELYAPIDITIDMERYDMIKELSEYKSVKIFTYKLKFKLKTLPSKRTFNLPEVLEIARELFKNVNIPKEFDDFLYCLFYNYYDIENLKINVEEY